MSCQFQPDDRVLVLQPEIHSATRLREWAQALTVGVLVGLGDKSAISSARKELADCENTLFAAGSRHEIPWVSGYFTVIVDVEGGAESPGATPEVTIEMRRVLHPAGRIYSIQP